MAPFVGGGELTVNYTDAEANLLARIKTGTWLEQQDFPATKWAVPGLIPEGFGLLTGSSKIGKSWAVLGIGLAVACGGKALGKVPTGRPRPVLYLALEDGPKRLQWRARQLLGPEEIPRNFHHVTEVEPANVTILIRLWMSIHGKDDPIVMLDTLGKVMPPSFPGESSYQRDYRIGGQLKSITDEHVGSTLLVVHHTRKQTGEDWMDSTSGTNGLNGAADFTMNLSRPRNKPNGIIRVTGRDVPENEYAVTVTDGAWTLDGDTLAEAADAAQRETATQGLGDDSAEVLRFVASHPNGVRAKDVARHMTWTEDKTRPYLARLVEADRLARAGRGLYVRVTNVTSVTNPDQNVTLVTDVTHSLGAVLPFSRRGEDGAS